MSCGPLFAEAVKTLKITKGPYYDSEGIAGYIETEVEIELKDLRRFTNIWEGYDSLTNTRKLGGLWLGERTW